MLPLLIYFSILFIILMTLFMDSYSKNYTLGTITSGIGLVATMLVLHHLQTTKLF